MASYILISFLISSIFIGALCETKINFDKYESCMISSFAKPDVLLNMQKYERNCYVDSIDSNGQIPNQLSTYLLFKGISKMNPESLEYVANKHKEQNGTFPLHVSIRAYDKEFHFFPNGSYEIRKESVGSPNNFMLIRSSNASEDDFVNFLDDDSEQEDGNDSNVRNLLKSPFIYGRVAKAIIFFAKNSK